MKLFLVQGKFTGIYLKIVGNNLENFTVKSISRINQMYKLYFFMKCKNQSLINFEKVSEIN